MGVSHKWLKIVRMKFLRSSNNKHKTLPRTNVCTNQNEEAILGRNEPTTTTITREDEHFNLAIQPADPLSILTKEDVAAIKIQSYFRGHLARRAYGALKSLVKLQALVRGVFVRKQSRIAMHCMHALVRLQVKIRARQLLGSFDHN